MALSRGGVSRCLPPPLVASHVLLSVVYGTIAAFAFIQDEVAQPTTRLDPPKDIASDDWFFQYRFFVILCDFTWGHLPKLVILVAWFWIYSHGLSADFVFVCISSAPIFLLCNYRADLCHQSNDEDEEDEESGSIEPLLEKMKMKPSSSRAQGRRRWCSLRSIRVGSRQKFVILVIGLIFVFMIAFALLIWIGRGSNPIDSALVARVYLDVFSVAMLLIGGALASYGGILSARMRNVRSDMGSSEMWKVASLAAVSLICFTSSSVIALANNIPLEVLSYWQSSPSNSIYSSIFIFVYYFVGYSVPSGFVLWVMRQMPPASSVQRPTQTRIVTIIRDNQMSPQIPQWRTTVESSQNKALKASPI